MGEKKIKARRSWKEMTNLENRIETKTTLCAKLQFFMAHGERELSSHHKHLVAKEFTPESFP